jgi:hypothetical protein
MIIIVYKIFVSSFERNHLDLCYNEDTWARPDAPLD